MLQRTGAILTVNSIAVGILDTTRGPVTQAIDEAVEFSDASPDPDLETIEEGVYA